MSGHCSLLSFVLSSGREGAWHSSQPHQLLLKYSQTEADTAHSTWASVSGDQTPPHLLKTEYKSNNDHLYLSSSSQTVRIRRGNQALLSSLRAPGSLLGFWYSSPRAICSSHNCPLAQQERLPSLTLSAPSSPLPVTEVFFHSEEVWG
jgi:hypothetical protein